MVADTMRKRWRFFLDNAGHATPPGRVKCAMDLARAEEWGEEMQSRDMVVIEWLHDGDAEDDWMTDHDRRQPWYEDGALGCAITDGKGNRVSLWGIWGATQDYQRVVEAELLAELMHETGALGIDFVGE